MKNLKEIIKKIMKSLLADLWIKRTDDLPDNKSYVLVTIKIPGRQAHVRSGWYEDGLFINDNGDTWNSTDPEVIAWLPSPDPYEEQY